jgi:hypothetical protein
MPMTVGDLPAALSGPLLDLGSEHQVQHHQSHRGTEFFEAVLGPALQSGQACGLFGQALGGGFSSQDTVSSLHRVGSFRVWFFSLSPPILSDEPRKNHPTLFNYSRDISWRAVRQLLKEEGIDPAGVAVLAANDTRMTTAADIERAAQKYAAASGSSLDEARAIVHPFFYGRFRKIAQKLEQSLGGKDAPQAAQRLAALARLHAGESAAERGASSRISGEVSQAGDLGDLSQTPPSQAPSTPAINDPTVPLHSRLRAYLLYADIEQKFSHAKNLARLEKRAGREGGLVLISDASAPVAVDLSDVPSGKFNLPKPHPRQRRH